MVLRPADAARSRVFRWLGPLGGVLFRDRALRVAWLGVVSVALSFFITASVPLWSLALGPVLLGVPHLLADIRYLVVRPGLHRLPWLVALMSVPLLMASLGFGPAWGLLAVVPAVLVSMPASARRKLLVLCAWLALTAAAWSFDVGFQLVFLHLHNLIAVGMWWLWSPRANTRAWWVPAAVFIGVIALLTGVADPLLGLFSGWSAPTSGASFDDFIQTTLPMMSHSWAMRWVLVFAFLQSVHYAMWLRLIPDDDRPRVAPRRFRDSADALISELGWPLLSFITLFAFFIAAWGLINLYDARMGYLRVAGFHGYLELAVLARWATRGSVRCT